MRTTNPALNASVFAKARGGAGEVMTLNGTVNKTFALLLILSVSAVWVWNKLLQPAATVVFNEPGTTQSAAQNIAPFMMVGVFGGFIIAMVTIFKKEWAPVSAPLYALFEGLFLGGFSALMELSYPGIVMQAVALTFGTLFALLLAYKSGMIKVTDNFRLGIIAATGGIALVYFMSLILGLFKINMPFIFSSGPIGIGFSLFVVVIAAMNLVLDFDFIEQGVAQGVPKYMEWYAAFGLMVTLVWLYLEILRLLSKLRDRR